MVEIWHNIVAFGGSFTSTVRNPGVHVSPPCGAPRSDPWGMWMAQTLLLVVQMCWWTQLDQLMPCCWLDLSKKRQKATGAILSFATFACVTQTFWVGQHKFAKYNKSDLNCFFVVCCVKMTHFKSNLCLNGYRLTLLTNIFYLFFLMELTWMWLLYLNPIITWGGLDLQAPRRSWTYAALHKVSSKAD